MTLKKFQHDMFQSPKYLAITLQPCSNGSSLYRCCCIENELGIQYESDFFALATFVSDKREKKILGGWLDGGRQVHFVLNHHGVVHACRRVIE